MGKNNNDSKSRQLLKKKKKKEQDRPVVPAGMTPNRLYNVKVRESKHLVRSHRGGSVPIIPTAD
jgi:hypothetical protein